MEDLQEKIERLVQMKQSGEISQTEFDQLKASALSSQQGTEPPATKSL